MTQAEFPTEGAVLTHLYVVSDLDRSRHFNRDVLGASVYREYGGTSFVLSFQGSWLLLVTEVGPTKDKPTVTFATPKDPNTVSHELTLRVPDCQAAYETLKARGADFLTRPLTGVGRSAVSFATQMATFWRSARPRNLLHIVREEVLWVLNQVAHLLYRFGNTYRFYFGTTNVTDHIDAHSISVCVEVFIKFSSHL